MKEIIILLSILLFIAITTSLYYRGNNKIRTKIHYIESLLNDNSMPMDKRIEYSKGVCRETKGIVFYAIYCVLDSIERNSLNQ